MNHNSPFVLQISFRLTMFSCLRSCRIFISLSAVIGNWKQKIYNDFERQGNKEKRFWIPTSLQNRLSKADEEFTKTSPICLEKTHHYTEPLNNYVTLGDGYLVFPDNCDAIQVSH